jgi:hypothetical protein
MGTTRGGNFDGITGKVSKARRLARQQGLAARLKGKLKGGLSALSQHDTVLQKRAPNCFQINFYSLGPR